MNRHADRSEVQIAPRFIRMQDAPAYLAMEEELFNSLVRPKLVAIRISAEELVLDRKDLDMWADTYKHHNGGAAFNPETRKPKENTSNRPVCVLRLGQVCKITGLGRSWIYQLEAEKRFPARIKIGLRAVGWIEEEVQEWLVNRIQTSRSAMLETT